MHKHATGANALLTGHNTGKVCPCLQVWLLFLQQFNGKSLFLSDQWLPDHILHLFTDAAGSLGYGAVFGKQWFYGGWPQSWSRENITLKEFYPIVAAVYAWGHCWENKKILIHTDNEALVSIINSNTAKEVKVMALVRKLVVRSMLRNIQFRAVHVPGCVNILADNLSRQQVAAFKTLAPWAREQPVSLPVEIQPQSWFPGC